MSNKNMFGGTGELKIYNIPKMVIFIWNVMLPEEPNKLWRTPWRC